MLLIDNAGVILYSLYDQITTLGEDPRTYFRMR
jgi:hypothetical protein